MTTAAPPPADDATGEPAGDSAASARQAAADAARLAAEVKAHEEHLARLQAEAAARAADDARRIAEARVRELEAQLAERAAHDDELTTAYVEEQPVDANTLSLFDDPQPVTEPSLAPDGSDPGVLPMALIGVAIVAGMAALLAFVNDRPGFGIFMLGITVLLLWFASATWVTPIEISITRGIVYIDHGSTKHRFDLRNERTQVEMTGEPGDSDWEVRFVRRGLDPFVISDGMVDSRAFVTQLREWRPDL